MTQQRSKGFIDSLFASGKDAFKPGNLLLRLGFFLFFGFLLGLQTLIFNLDNAGRTGAGILGYLKAIAVSTWSGIGVSLASIWSLITQWNQYISMNASGSIAIGIVMALFVVGFFFQPVSLIVNLFDMKNADQTGNDSGQVMGSIVRLTFTIMVVLVLSAMTFYSGISNSLLTNLQEPSDGGSVAVDGANSEVYVDNQSDVSITNSIDMLAGGS